MSLIRLITKWVQFINSSCNKPKTNNRRIRISCLNLQTMFKNRYTAVEILISFNLVPFYPYWKVFILRQRHLFQWHAIVELFSVKLLFPATLHFRPSTITETVTTDRLLDDSKHKTEKQCLKLKWCCSVNDNRSIYV